MVEIVELVVLAKYAAFTELKERQIFLIPNRKTRKIKYDLLNLEIIVLSFLQTIWMSASADNKNFQMSDYFLV